MTIWERIFGNKPENKVEQLPDNWGKIKTESGYVDFDDEDLDYNTERVEEAKKNLQSELKEKLYWMVNADLTIGRTPFSKKLRDVGLLFPTRATARLYRRSLKENQYRLKWGIFNPSSSSKYDD